MRRCFSHHYLDYEFDLDEFYELLLELELEEDLELSEELDLSELLLELVFDDLDLDFCSLFSALFLSFCLLSLS